MNKNDNPQNPKEFDVLFHKELILSDDVDTILAMLAVGFKNNLLLNSMDVYLNKALQKYPYNKNVSLFFCYYYLNQIHIDEFPYELEDIQEIHTDPARKLALDKLTEVVSEAIIKHPHESSFLYLRAVVYFWNQDFVSSKIIMCYLLQDREERDDVFYSLCAYSFFHLEEYNFVIELCIQNKGEKVNEIPSNYILLIKSWIAIKEFDYANKLVSTLLKDFETIQSTVETAIISSIEKKKILHKLDTCKEIVNYLVNLCNSKQQEQENQSVSEQILGLISKRKLEEAQTKLDNYNKLLTSLNVTQDIEGKINSLHLAALIKYKQKKYTEAIFDIDTFFSAESEELAEIESERYFKITKDLFLVLLSCLTTQKEQEVEHIIVYLIKIIRRSFTSNRAELIKWTEMFCKATIKTGTYKETLAELNVDCIWKATPFLQSAYIKVNIETGNYDVAEQTCNYVKSLFGIVFSEYLYFKSLIAYKRKEYTMALTYIETYIHTEGQDKDTADLKDMIVEKLNLTRTNR